MHEAGLAARLVEAALKIARQHQARRIVAVRGWIADSEALDCVSIEQHFAARAAGTEAAGARLELKLDHVAARCVECSATYLPTGHLTLCPQCGSSQAVLTGRTGAGIDSVEVED
jgi:hydrogenase nickel insertion protein HypA